ncbi:MAG: C1 family peptidase, partial [Candidatus Bathyarchaeia archaeon]
MSLLVSSSGSVIMLGGDTPHGEELTVDGGYALGCLGGGFTEEDRLKNMESGLFSSYSLPDALDWRSYQGTNWVSPVRDQGYMGSCVAFGVLGALEPRLRVFYSDPDWGIDLSEQHVYEFGGGLPEGGMYISDALEYMALYGSPEEWCNPYN